MRLVNYACGVGEVLARGPRGQVRSGRAWWHRRRLLGDSSSESCCYSLQQQWWRRRSHPRNDRSRDPRDPRPQSPGFLDGDSPLNAAPAKLCGFHVTYGVPWGRLRHLQASAGRGESVKGSWGRSGHCPLRFSAHNRPYLMTMAAAGCKQGIILDRLWTALLLVSSKGPREASKLTKRPTDQIFDEKKCPPIFSFSDFFGRTVFHLGTTMKFGE